MPAQLIFGDIKELDPTELKAVLQNAGIGRIDTAARYMGGESERKIGRAKLPETFLVDTKVLLGTNGGGDLAPEAIERSLSNSLNVLGVEKVNVLYCHGPDNVTPVAEQAKAFDEQYRKAKFAYLGVSNFSTRMLEEWLAIAEAQGYVKPSVYQGQYNLLCRGFETSLFPLLRKHNIKFNAFSPLAGGFLLGNFTENGVQGGTRFSVASPFLSWYDKPSMHQAVKNLRAIAADTGLTMDEMAIRWLVYHSILSDQDAVILGASKISHVDRSAAQIKKGPLDEAVVSNLEQLWELVLADGRKITEF